MGLHHVHELARGYNHSRPRLRAASTCLLRPPSQSPWWLRVSSRDRAGLRPFIPHYSAYESTLCGCTCKTLIQASPSNRDMQLHALLPLLQLHTFAGAETACACAEEEHTVGAYLQLPA